MLIDFNKRHKLSPFSSPQLQYHICPDIQVMNDHCDPGSIQGTDAIRRFFGGKGLCNVHQKEGGAEKASLALNPRSPKNYDHLPPSL